MTDRRSILTLLAIAGLVILVAMASNAEEIPLGTFEGGDGGRRIRPQTGIARDAPPVIETEVIEVAERTRVDLPDFVGWAFGAVGVLVALWLLSQQRINIVLGRRRAQRVVNPSTADAGAQAQAIAEFADGLIGELELGPDPRLAIQRAYAAVEGGFGTRELRRKAAETPLKYLDRIFGRRRQAAEPLGRLTDLFQLARFSNEPITEDMRSDAVGALRSIRDEYRAIARAKGPGPRARTKG
ncbi:MAG: DUF4129 domain-containing protein [Actinomycetota bacterium]